MVSAHAHAHAQAQAHAASKTNDPLYMFVATIEEPNRCQQLPITNLARFHIRTQALLNCHHANWVIDFARSMRMCRHHGKCKIFWAAKDAKIDV